MRLLFVYLLGSGTPIKLFNKQLSFHLPLHAVPNYPQTHATDNSFLVSCVLNYSFTTSMLTGLESVGNANTRLVYRGAPVSFGCSILYPRRSAPQVYSHVYVRRPIKSVALSSVGYRNTNRNPACAAACAPLPPPPIAPPPQVASGYNAIVTIKTLALIVRLFSFVNKYLQGNL